jgi:GntR family transcriptional regulator/MocR family aminotransferase
VIEDDYDGEFRYDRQPVGALQGLAPDRVVYAGTASKTVAPGLRIAWIVVPADLVEPLRTSLRWDEAHVNIIEQLVFAQLIRSGELDRHLRRCRIRYRRQRDRLGEAIRRDVPSGRLSGIAAGLHAVLELPDNELSERRLLGQLTRSGVAVEGIAYFYHRPEDVAPRARRSRRATPGARHTTPDPARDAQCPASVARPRCPMACAHGARRPAPSARRRLPGARRAASPSRTPRRSRRKRPARRSAGVTGPGRPPVR